MGESHSGGGATSTDSTASDKDSSVCPTCQRELKTTRAMRTHHTKVHGESLIKESGCCESCGDEFEYYPQNRPNANYCSNYCWSVENTGETNPAYKGGKEELVCNHCGDVFRVTPALKDIRKHCSDQCKAKTMSKRSGKATPNYRGGGVEKSCRVCDSTFVVKEARKEIATYCSRDCMAEWYSENLTGENAPGWQGGDDYWYGPNWLKQREKARRRDQFRCQVCRDTAASLGEAPCVHHIRPVWWYQEKYEGDKWWQDGNDLSNLISLCRSCHQQAEGWFLSPDVR